MSLFRRREANRHQASGTSVKYRNEALDAASRAFALARRQFEDWRGWKDHGTRHDRAFECAIALGRLADEVEWLPARVAALEAEVAGLRLAAEAAAALFYVLHERGEYHGYAHDEVCAMWGALHQAGYVGQDGGEEERCG